MKHSKCTPPFDTTDLVEALRIRGWLPSPPACVAGLGELIGLVIASDPDSFDDGKAFEALLSDSGFWQLDLPGN